MSFLCYVLSLLCPFFVMSYLCYVLSLLCPIFVMSYFCYVLSLLCHIFVMSFLCYVLSLLCPIFVMSYLCYVLSLSCPIFVMSYLCYVLSLLCPIFVMSFLCHVLSLLGPICLMFNLRILWKVYCLRLSYLSGILNYVFIVDWWRVYLCANRNSWFVFFISTSRATCRGIHLVCKGSSRSTWLVILYAAEILNPFSLTIFPQEHL